MKTYLFKVISLNTNEEVKTYGSRMLNNYKGNAEFLIFDTKTACWVWVDAKDYIPCDDTERIDVN